MNPASTVFVVIPFYQRKRGVLVRALKSVLLQKDAPTMNLIVVDDGSPVPAAEDVSALSGTAAERVRIVRQANSGAAAARNRGLDEIPRDTRYVAFLDSDDEWAPTHLANAVRALDAGHDFYFADYRPLDDNANAFERVRFRTETHSPLTGQPDCYSLVGDFVPTLMLAPPVGTPTVVYRHERFSGLRFERGYRLGEDILFWIALASAGARVCFSTQVETRCGEGINICQGASWGDRGAVRRQHDMLRFKHRLLALAPAVTPKVREQLLAELEGHRRALVGNLLHHLVHYRRIDLATLGAALHTDPRLALSFVPQLIHTLRERLAR